MPRAPEFPENPVQEFFPRLPDEMAEQLEFEVALGLESGVRAAELTESSYLPAPQSTRPPPSRSPSRPPSRPPSRRPCRPRGPRRQTRLAPGDIRLRGECAPTFFLPFGLNFTPPAHLYPSSHVITLFYA
jgi:hypothetical protein